MPKETPEQAVAKLVAKRGGAKKPQVASRRKAKPKKHAGGRPTKYNAKVHPGLVLLTAKEGATWSAIAGVCMVAESTVKLWAETHEEFSAAVTRAKHIADDLVENALFRRALGGGLTPPDTKACTVWLGNRRPESWRDTSRVEVTGANGGPVQHEDLNASEREQLAHEASAYLALREGAASDSPSG